MRRIDTDDTRDERIDMMGVSNLAQAMRAKLKQKRLEGYSGWHDPYQCTIKRLKLMLRGHLRRGDMIDVANFAMMIYNREHCMKDKP
jgi:hypothetical protein